MFICENCGKEFIAYGSNRFCSRACANTRHHTTETKKKISSRLKGTKPWNSGLSKDTDARVSAHSSLLKKRRSPIFVKCAFCGKEIDIAGRKKNANNRYFCNGTCRNRLLNSTKEIGGIHKGYSTSAWEKQVQSLLEKYDIKFEANKRDLIPSRYEIDIWVPEQKIAIELNGIWHYSSKPYGGNVDALKRRQEKDRIKKQEVENLGYKFFAFEDRDIENVEMFFDNFIKENILQWGVYPQSDKLQKG